MSSFNRMKSSTAVIATLAAGMVLLAATGHANAKDGNGGNGAANGTSANSAGKTTPTYTCWACRFVKRDSTDKLERKPDSGRDMPGRNKSGHDKSDHADKHDKDHDREHLGDGKHKMPQPGGKPVETTGGKPTQPGGKPVETTGGKPTQPVDSAKSTVGISNGVTNRLITNGPNGLTVSADKSLGKITVSNGTDSVTMNGGSLVLSGIDVNLKSNTVGCAGCVMMKNPTGGYTIGIDYQYELRNPPKAPAPGTVTGGREGGFLGALGSSILDGGKAIVELPFNLGGPTPPPKTSTTTQQ